MGDDKARSWRGGGRLIRDHLPELGANLIAALATLDSNDFTCGVRGAGLGYKKAGRGDQLHGVQRCRKRASQGQDSSSRMVLLQRLQRQVQPTVRWRNRDRNKGVSRSDHTDVYI